MNRYVMHRRGTVLLAVMIIMAIAIYMTTTMLFLARGESAGMVVARDDVQSRALASSGLAAVISVLNEQRDVILEGRSPRIESQYTVFDSDGDLGIVRLLPVAADGARLMAENGKLDLNAATADQLAATGLLDPAQAQAVISHRDGQLGGVFQSLAEVLQVEDITAELLYGPLEDVTPRDDASLGERNIRERMLDRLDASQARGLIDVVTVYGFEPALQRNGRLRINLNVEWSDELGQRIADRFDQNVAGLVREIMANGTQFDSEGAMYRVLRFFDVDPSEWADAIDTFSAEPHDFHIGRMDINTAPYEALLALPGIEPEHAASMVQVRDDLSDAEREVIAWPAIHGILDTVAYEELGGMMTCRSWSYRIRIASGTVLADDPEGEMNNPRIFEAVIDLSDPRPRIAYLRDISNLQIVAQLVSTDLEHGEEEPDSPLADREFDIDAETIAGDDDPSLIEEAAAMFDHGDFEDSTDESMMDDETGMPGEHTTEPAGGSGGPHRRVGRWLVGR